MTLQRALLVGLFGIPTLSLLSSGTQPVPACDPPRLDRLRSRAAVTASVGDRQQAIRALVRCKAAAAQHVAVLWSTAPVDTLYLRDLMYETNQFGHPTIARAITEVATDRSRASVLRGSALVALAGQLDPHIGAVSYTELADAVRVGLVGSVQSHPRPVNQDTPLSSADLRWIAARLQALVTTDHGDLGRVAQWLLGQERLRQGSPK